MVPISPNIYSAEAVIFDNKGLFDLQQKLAAKKSAKEDALNKYFTDLQGKINTAGVRTKDLRIDPSNPASPGILTDIENWQKNWNINKDSIAKGGLAQQEHLNKFNEIVRRIQQSKDRVKTLEEVSKLKQQGKINEEDFLTIDKIDASIYDPKGYKKDGITEYGIGDFSEFIPTWDAPKRKQFIDYASGGVEPAGKANEKTIIDPYTKRKVTTFDKVYTLDQLRKMAERAIAISSDKSALKTYNKLLKEGEQDIPSDEFISLAKAYNSVNPNDVMDTPIKVAMADIILNKIGVVGSGRTAEAKPGGTGGGTGYGTINERNEIEGNAFDETGIVKTISFRGGSSIVNGVVRDAKGEKASGEISDFKYEDLPANLTNVLEFNKTPISKSKSITLYFEDGQIIGLKQEGKPFISRKTVENAQLKYNTEALKGMQPTFGRTLPSEPKTTTKKQKTYSIKGKTYSEKELLNMGYTLDDIAPFLKK
jgi:hypothetical protein